MYKLASQLKLRVKANQGLLSVEQLWGLSIPELDTIAVELETEYKNSGAKSFVVKKSAKNKEIKLKFDIVLDILNTKVEAAELATTERERKIHNDKILNLIAKKQDNDLTDKSIEELEKMLK